MVRLNRRTLDQTSERFILRYFLSREHSLCSRRTSLDDGQNRTLTSATCKQTCRTQSPRNQLTRPFFNEDGGGASFRKLSTPCGRITGPLPLRELMLQSYRTLRDVARLEMGDISYQL